MVNTTDQRALSRKGKKSYEQNQEPLSKFIWSLDQHYLNRNQSSLWT